MALTKEQVELISVAAFGVAPGEVHSNYFLESDKAGKFFIGETGKQIHEVLGLKEPLTGTAAVAAVLEHEYNYLVSINGLDKVSDAAFVKNVAKNLGAEDSKTLAVDLASGMSRYEALAKFAQAEADKAGGIENVAGIITAQKSDKTLVNAEKALKDSAAKPDTPTKPEVDGITDFLTEGRDDMTGTADNDWFIADAGQNSQGYITNALSTGDRIDGGAGTDTLEVTLIADSNVNATMAPRPFTKSVENVFINALAQGNANSNNSTAVQDTTRLNADEMKDLEQLWSNQSEGSLRVENVANPGDTEDLTIGMRSTGNAGSTPTTGGASNRNESNYEVYFEEVELTAGQNAGTESLSYNMLDQTAFDNGENPLSGFALDGLSFQLDGASYTLSFDNAIQDTPDTYEGLVAALNALLSADYPNLVAEGVKFETGADFTDPDGRVGTTVNLSIPSTDPTNPRLDFLDTATPYTSIQFGSSPSNNIYRLAEPLDPQGPTGQPVTATVILDDVGRGSDGGFLRVGSMSEGSTSSTGIEVFDLTVQRDSSLSGLFTTNRALDEIHITSDAGDGDLAIGNNRSGVDVTEFDLDLIQTNGFAGNLSLGTPGATVKNLTTLNTVDMGASQSTTFRGAILGNDEDVYTYSTGQGEDFISLFVETDAVDSIGTDLTINTNSGNDDVRLSSNDHASQLTQSLLDNVKINTGAGDDYVYVADTIRTNINAGAGSDFVEFAGGNNGQWFIGQASGPQAFGDRVLYQADLTLTFAGFENTVKIKTDASGKFIASQVDINNAIMAAIQANPELDRLLTATEVEGTQQLSVVSTVGGLNDLGIVITQPTVVANNATSGEVNVPGSSELNALIQGLINTTPLDSDNFTNGAADVVTEFVNLGYNGNVDANGGTTAADYQAFDDGGSFDAFGSDINYSVIDMGTGSNDLLVLDSNDNSANVLKVSAAFGKVSVVNFHDISPNDVANVSEVGNHAIDFTKFLDNEVDPSATPSTESLVKMPVSLNTNAQLGGSAASTGVALANSVNMLNFDGTVANSVSFKALTAGDLVSALNNVPAAGVPVVGGIINTTLDAVNNTTNLIGSVQKHIVMIENDQNPGEYKVFHLTSTVDTTTNTTNGEFDANGAQVLGTLDFGNSINFNLVGSTEFGGIEGIKGIYDDLLRKADDPDYVPTEAPSEEPTDPNFVTVKPVDSVAVATDAADAITFTNLETGQFTITGFNAAEDKLVLTGLTGADGATLAELAGDTIDSGVIGVQVNEIAGSTFVNLGNDADNAVISIELAGVTDPALVNVDLA